MASAQLCFYLASWPIFTRTRPMTVTKGIRKHYYKTHGSIVEFSHSPYQS